MSKVYYLAGPMSGIPQFNYPLFDRVSASLREQGYDIRSPAEMDDPETRKEALSSKDGVLVGGTCNGESWGDFLARDVKLIADEVQGVILLPEWETSRGARLEAFVALGCGHEVCEYHEGVMNQYYTEVFPCTPRYIMNKITQAVS